MPEQPEACGNCKFVLAINGNLECHRMPPTVSLLFGQDQKTKAPMVAASVSTWPTVRLDQYCGEFRRRIILATELPVAPLRMEASRR